MALRAAAQLTTKPTAPVEYGLRLALFQRWQDAKPERAERNQNWSLGII